MRKYFISSDIHNFYDEYITALKEKKFNINNKNHILIICGDIFDRGSKANEIFYFLKNMKEKNRLILIKGNHESLLKSLIYERDCAPSSADFHNGVVDTIEQLTGLDILSPKEEIIRKLKEKGVFELLSSALDYYETKNYIFVHGWIPYKIRGGKYLYDPKWREASKKEWEHARWYNGMELATEGILEPEKTIICGHWHCSYGNVRREYKSENYTERDYSFLEFSDKNLFKAYYGDGIIAIDACTTFTNFCNVLVLGEDEL